MVKPPLSIRNNLCLCEKPHRPKPRSNTTNAHATPTNPNVFKVRSFIAKSTPRACLNQRKSMGTDPLKMKTVWLFGLQLNDTHPSNGSSLHAGEAAEEDVERQVRSRTRKQERFPPSHVRADRRDGGADILGSSPVMTPTVRKWV